MLKQNSGIRVLDLRSSESANGQHVEGCLKNNVDRNSEGKGKGTENSSSALSKMSDITIMGILDHAYMLE